MHRQDAGVGGNVEVEYELEVDSVSRRKSDENGRRNGGTIETQPETTESEVEDSDEDEYLDDRSKRLLAVQRGEAYQSPGGTWRRRREEGS